MREDLSASELVTIAVSSERNRKIQLSSVVKRMNFIPLETNPKSSMGIPAKIEFDAGRYFVFDKDIAKAILIFDSTGRYVSRIGGRGSGPGEFHTVSAFTLDKARRQVVAGDNCKWLRRFDYSGRHISDSALDLCYADLAVVRDDLIAFSARKKINYRYYDSMSSRKVDTECFNLWISGPTSGTTKHFPFDINVFPNGSLRINAPLDFSRYRSQLMYTLAFSDTIYQIQAENVSCKYFIDFGAMKSKDDLVNKGGEWILNYYKSDPESAYFVRNFIETDDMIKFDYQFGSKVQTAFISKRDSSILAGELDNDIFGLPLVMHQSVRNTMITYISPLELHELLKNNTDDSISWVEYLRELCSKYGPSDNYVLVEIELRQWGQDEPQGQNGPRLSKGSI